MSRVLGLRTCKEDRTSYNGFRWPREGPIEAPDWSAEPVCGHGLHALLWGVGDSTQLNWLENALWQVVEFDSAAMVDLKGKVKFPCCTVLYTGTRAGATQYLYANGGAGKAIAGLTLTGGDGSTLTGGDRSTLTGGYGSTLTGGDGSMLMIRFWQGDAERFRAALAFVGENGIRAKTPYRLDASCEFVEATI